MKKIEVLQEHIANQIAAGEVVERPASAVKELIENALDAGAKNIEIRIKEGGLGFIVVEDDGNGISPSELSLAIQRFATSKLSSVHDLSLGLIDTFGFRGEALPSIASVSNFYITSKISSEEYATTLYCKDGKVVDVNKIGGKNGTKVLVKDLFYNVPARLKFVKSKRSETYAIDKLVRSFSFIHPDISWKFFCDDKPVFIHNVFEGNSYERVVNLLGAHYKGNLYPICGKTDVLSIEGMVSSPLISAKDTRNIYIFVNNRLISDKKILSAIKVSFRSLLEVGNNPSLAINIKIDKSMVDVNVHPRKAEVRFADEGKIFSHVVKVLTAFLSKTPWLNHSEATLSSLAEKKPANNFYYPTKEQYAPLRQSFEFLLNPTVKEEQTFSPMLKVAPVFAQQVLMPEEKYSDLKVLGQFGNLYILLESAKGLIILDQHAAHERIVFEKIVSQKQENFIIHQLLIPIKVELSFGQKNLLLDHLKDFHTLGFDMELFGENSVLIRGVPEFFIKENTQDLIYDILSEFEEMALSNQKSKMFDHMCATIACHSSIRAGQKLQKEEIENLLLQLDTIDFNAHCPHGRPIVKWFSQNEIKKWFHRP